MHTHNASAAYLDDLALKGERELGAGLLEGTWRIEQGVLRHARTRGSRNVLHELDKERGGDVEWQVADDPQR